jgi:hypothetical protein
MAEHDDGAGTHHVAEFVDSSTECPGGWEIFTFDVSLGFTPTAFALIAP